MKSKFIRIVTTDSDIVFQNIDYIVNVWTVSNESCRVEVIDREFNCSNMSAEQLIERIEMLYE